MSLEKLESLLAHKLSDLAQNQTLRGREPVISGSKPATGGFGPRYFLAEHGDKEFLRMNSNSYLNLSMNPLVIKAEEEAAVKFGTGPGAVRFISGTYAPHVDLEVRLASFHGREAAMLFSAAYSAIIGVLPLLVTPETIVVSDALNHNSIINALRLSRPAAKTIYAHLNIQELEALLDSNKSTKKRAIVVTDGIFSMRGDHAPLKEIAAACASFNETYEEGVILVVDDSHGIGAFGTTGRGVEEFTGAHADILIGTLGKAFGVNGGYVASSQTLISYLRETAPLYIYSNPITPPEAAAAIQSLKIINSDAGSKMLSNLRNHTKRFEDGIKRIGLEIISSEHPIVPLMIRNSAKTAALCRHLFENGILATGLNFPVVPKGDEEIRFQVSASHTEKDIDFVLDVLSFFNPR